MTYHKINEQDYTYFQNLLKRENLLYGPEIQEDYSHDELSGTNYYPELLIRPESTDEVSLIMHYAWEKEIPVVVRGAGTSLVGSSVAIYGGIMLDMLRMNQILELDEDNLTVTVQPGVLLMDLAEYTLSHHFLYPPDPGEKSATIGGNISTNAGGMRAVKYGVTRDYVLGLTVVLPDGQIQNLGGKVVKTSSGYDLKNLIIGSEGTLAVITEAILKLIPCPEYSISLLIPFETMEDALRVVPYILKARSVPTALEYMSRQTILFSEEYLGKKFPDSDSEAYLLLTYDGSSPQQVQIEYEITADLCMENKARDVYLVDTQERKDSVWNARGAFLEAIKASTTDMDECDVVVPRNRIAEYITYTYSIARSLHMRIPSFGHAGDGNLHIYLCRDNMEAELWQKAIEKAFHLMYQKAREFGGQVSGEHGIGSAKKRYLLESLGKTQIQLMKGIKTIFDPKNIMNPGKIV